MKNLFVVLGLVAVSLGGARLASAGTKRVNPLTISTSGRYAFGDLGSIRATADGNQRLYCEVINTTTAPMAFCWASDSTYTNFGSCVSSNPNIVQAAASAKGDGGVSFYWDANSNCTEIVSYADSAAMPKIN